MLEQVRHLSNLLWKMIFVRSKGAIVVFATAPATAPALRELITSLNSFRMFSSWFSESS